MSFVKNFTVSALILVTFCCIVVIVAFTLQDANSRQKILADKYSMLQANNEKLLNTKNDLLGDIETLQKTVLEKNAEIKQLNERLNAVANYYKYDTTKK